MRRPLTWNEAIVMAVCFLLTLAACDPIARVKGSVYDASHKPLEGVTVTLQTEGRSPHQSVTGSDGAFAVSMVGADPLHTRLLFEKPGYRSLERPLGKEYSSVVEATLQPDAP